MDLFVTLLYLVGLYSAFLAGSLYLRTQFTDQTKRKVPYATFTLALLIAIPSTLQFFFPVIQKLSKIRVTFRSIAFCLF